MKIFIFYMYFFFFLCMNLWLYIEYWLWDKWKNDFLFFCGFWNKWEKMEVVGFFEVFFFDFDLFDLFLFLFFFEFDFLLCWCFLLRFEDWFFVFVIFVVGLLEDFLLFIWFSVVGGLFEMLLVVFGVFFFEFLEFVLLKMVLKRFFDSFIIDIIEIRD